MVSACLEELKAINGHDASHVVQPFESDNVSHGETTADQSKPPWSPGIMMIPSDRLKLDSSPSQSHLPCPRR